MTATSEPIWQAIPTLGRDVSGREFVHIPPAPPLPRKRWGRALRSIRELVSQPESPDA